MNVRYVVLKDTTDRLEGMAGRLDGRVRKIANYAAGTMSRGAAKMLVAAGETSPGRHETGLLRRSIKPKTVRIGPAHYRAIAGPRVFYGPFVEFGTGRRGRRDHSRFARRYGWPHITYKRRWAGMDAHPFLTPQPRAVKPEVDRRLAKALEDEWNGRGST